MTVSAISRQACTWAALRSAVFVKLITAMSQFSRFSRAIVPAMAHMSSSWAITTIALFTGLPAMILAAGYVFVGEYGWISLSYEHGKSATLSNISKKWQLGFTAGDSYNMLDFSCFQVLSYHERVLDCKFSCSNATGIW